MKRKFVQLINSFLISFLNAQIVRSYPKNFTFKRRKDFESLNVVEVHAKNSPDSEGFRIYLRPATSDWFTFNQIFIKDDYDLRFLKRYSKISSHFSNIINNQTQPLILDLGANIGLAAIYFSMVWPGSKVVSVEPSPDNYDILLKNIGQKNNYDSFMAGISSSSSRLMIGLEGGDKNAYTTSIVDNEDELCVEGITVPLILDQYPKLNYTPFIVKIDIEGFESDLFSKNCEWIDEFPILIIEMHDWLYPKGRTSENFLKAISKLNRDFIYYGENVFSISNSLID